MCHYSIDNLACRFRTSVTFVSLLLFLYYCSVCTLLRFLLHCQEKERIQGCYDVKLELRLALAYKSAEAIASMHPATQKMEDMEVDRDKSVSLIMLSDKAESEKSIEPEEDASGLQTSSSSLTETSTDIVVAQDADHERQRKSQTRMWVEWIFIGMVITAVWILIVGFPILFYHLPEVRSHPVIQYYYTNDLCHCGGLLVDLKF